MTEAVPQLEAPAPEPAKPESPPSPAREHATLLDYAESLLVTVLLVLFGTSFVVQAFKIPSPSMEGTLLVGDHLLVNKFVFGGRGAWYDRFLPYRDIRRGDIIVFKFPYDDHVHYVKRVIGLPGERLKIVSQQVYINGEPLDEPYKVHTPDSYEPFEDNFPSTTGSFPGRDVRPEWIEQMRSLAERGELLIPPNRYFVMGDNRDHSLDSRYWGFVDRENVMGKPILIYWSIESTTDDYNDRSAMGWLVGMADTIVNLPKKTRWDRMLRVVN